MLHCQLPSARMSGICNVRLVTAPSNPKDKVTKLLKIAMGSSQMATSRLQSVWFISSTDNLEELDVRWQYGSTHSSLQRAFVKGVACYAH